MFGPMYVQAKNQSVGQLTGVAKYTLAPHGTVLVKAQGVTKWIPSAMGKELFEMNIKHGHLVKVDQ